MSPTDLHTEAAPTNSVSGVSSSRDASVFADHKLLSIFLQVKQQNDAILEHVKNLRPASTSPSESILPDNLPIQFPINSHNELDELEHYLEETKNLLILTTHLSSLGGRGVVPKVNRILKYVFSNETASGFNYLGSRSNKKPFFQLKLKSVVVSAVKTTSTTNEKEIEDAIKIWLKHAPQRLKTEQKK